MSIQINPWFFRRRILVAGIVILFFVLGSCKAVFAFTGTGGDMSTYFSNLGSAGSGCFYYVKNTSGTTWQIYKRCGAASQVQHRSKIYNAVDYHRNDISCNATKCDGTGASIVINPPSWCEHGSTYIIYNFNCDGSQTVYQAQTQAALWLQNTAPCDVLDTVINSSCTNLDTLIATWNLTSSCTPSSGTISTVSAGVYGLAYMVPGNNANCSCIPDGTTYVSKSSSYSIANGRYETICQVQYLPNDPVTGYTTPTDTGGTLNVMGNTTPTDTSSGTTASGSPQPVSNPTGTQDTGTQSTTTSNTTGTTTNYTTATTTNTTIVTNQSGTGLTVTQTQTVANTASGQTTTTQTSSTQNVAIPGGLTVGAYQSGGAPTVGDFGSLFQGFANHVQGSALFQSFNLTNGAPSGNGTATVSFSMGRFGDHVVDYSAPPISTALAIAKGFILLVGGFLSIRAIIMKR